MRVCDHPGCEEEGVHRVRVAPEHWESYCWLCLSHARAHNRAWRFGRGLSAQQLEAILRADQVGRRPTWPRSPRPFNPTIDASGLGIDTGIEKKPRSDPREQAAWRQLGFEVAVTLSELTARYRALVKKYHPDANKGNRQGEKRFKRIIAAYRFLRARLAKQESHS